MKLEHKLGGDSEGIDYSVTPALCSNSRKIVTKIRYAGDPKGIHSSVTPA